MSVYTRSIERGVSSPKKKISDFNDLIEIDVMTKSTSTKIIYDGVTYDFFNLSPYGITDENHIYFENLWQFSKVFLHPIPVKERYSRYDPTIIWDYTPKGEYISPETSLPTEEWWEWRNKGFFSAYPIRYPNSYREKSKVAYTYWPDNGDYMEEEIPYKKLNYIEARKEVYLLQYCKLIRETKEFLFLKKLLSEEKKILIKEVDCFKDKDKSYYFRKYPQIESYYSTLNKTLRCDATSLKILINDPRNSFGHGFCLAACLLGIEKEISEK